MNASKNSGASAGALREQIVSAIQLLRPIQCLLPVFFVAEQERLSSAHDELATLDAAIADRCARRDAAARSMVALAGIKRPAPPPENVAFPFVRRAAQ